MLYNLWKFLLNAHKHFTYIIQDELNKSEKYLLLPSRRKDYH